MNVESTDTTARKNAPLQAAFAAQLRAERAAAGLSQTELASKSGVGRHTILRIENGLRVMDTAQLGDICRALGIDIVTFVLRVEERLAAERGEGEGRSARRA